MNKGERIKKQREHLNISQTDLAKLVGISKQTLYKYENGIVTNIPSDVIELLAKHLHCSPSYIMGWEDANDLLLEIENHLKNLSEQELKDVLNFIKFTISKKGG